MRKIFAILLAVMLMASMTVSTPLLLVFDIAQNLLWFQI